jgi:fatty acid amide hydrolase
MGSMKKFTKAEVDVFLRRKAKFEGQFKEMWQDLKLDGIICPVFPHAAFRHEDSDELGFFAYYTMLFNLIGYPAGTVPVTEVLAGEDLPTAYADAHNDIYTRTLQHSMAGSRGLPIGLQVVAPKWKDESCLALMQIVSDLVKF